jgi:hypothetical protein
MDQINKTTYEKLSVSDLHSKIAIDEIVLPRYQRDIVWDEERKQKLIDSIRNGFPIGSLLLAEFELIKSGVRHKVLKVIDGLQRTSTLQDYLNHPERFVRADWVLEDWINQVTAITERTGSPILNRDLIGTVLHQFLLKDKLKRDSLSLVDEFSRGFGQSVDLYTREIDRIQDSVATLIESINLSLDISLVEIPFIKFVGSLESQAEAFVRLNTYSIALDKYEVAAGNWSVACDLKNPDVQPLVKEYWSDRLERVGLEIEGIQEDGTPDQYLLYDVLIGVGLALRKKFPLLIEDNDVIARSIGFQISAISLGLRLNQITEIEERFRLSSSSDELVVDDFIDAIFKAAEILNDALYPVLGMRLASKTIRSQFQGHTVYQICSMIVSILMEAREEDGSWTKQIEKRTQSQSKSMQAWYLFDRLKGEWGNAGDSRLFNRIWSLDESQQNSKYVLSSFYENAPPRNLMELQLESWFADELEKQHSKRQLISSETKLILRFFYSSKVSFGHHYSKEFQLDHLIPLSWWKSLFKSVNQDASGPINCVGILALMSKEDHDTKGTMLPTDWFKSEVLPSGKSFAERCIKDYFLVDHNEFDFARPISVLKETRKLRKSELEKILRSFAAVCIDRWNIMKEDLLGSLYGETPEGK